MAMALLAAGCSKKSEGDAAGGSTTTAAAATGIKGKIKGKPFTGKTARVVQDSDGGNPTLYLVGFDAPCEKISFIPPKGENRASITAPLKKGTTKFDGDKIYASLSMWDDKGQISSNATNPKGEIEWLTVPTDKSKGLARVIVIDDANDTKLEGSMDADLCPKK
jgi:hypothetical protein